MITKQQEKAFADAADKYMAALSHEDHLYYLGRMHGIVSSIDSPADALEMSIRLRGDAFAITLQRAYRPIVSASGRTA